ncbi:MAG: GPI anchored serine-threonine rich family protein [Cytophagales bacterium]|nr:GPI anchored serine-threonine rich family protein [Cytophagales bacterium]
MFTLAFGTATAQQITNVEIATKGNLVVVEYDLVGSLPGQLFEVKLYGSHNEMREPLVYVRGDVGTGIPAGRGKRMEWGAKKEIGNFDGTMNLKVEATLIFSPMAVKTPKNLTVMRRGRDYKVSWDGGVEKENLQLELWKDTTLRFIITRVPNQGEYTWQPPMNLEPGDTYKVRLMSVNAPANYRFSEPFVIRRKYPLAAKLAPAGVVAGVGFWLLIRGLIGTEEDPLAEPPNGGKPE